jgi:hypothetical protein
LGSSTSGLDLTREYVLAALQIAGRRFCAALSKISI